MIAPVLEHLPAAAGPSPLEEARRAALSGLRGAGRPVVRRRRPEERRRYAQDPPAYMRDVLGLFLTSQQDEALEAMHRETRLLIPSGNNVGKTFLLGAYATFTMDAVAALPDEENGLPEQGARVLLPGPDAATIQATVYAEMLAHARRAERRGFAMPGRRSEDSVLWRVSPAWEVEAFSPPKRVGQAVAHTASGRHHRNQVALIEEGQGVEERLWRAVEGMCSSEGNKIISSFNPTEANGPAFQRARGGSYRVLHLSSLDHPNVRGRSVVIPAAVDFRVIDARVRECRDRGGYPAVRPDATHGEFLYALPPTGASERGPRQDGVLGHPDGEVRVYRPTPAFEAQVMGQWPRTSDLGLFNPGAWDAAVQRWLEAPEPAGLPDQVGVDAAREGEDETCYAPRWGEGADVLLRAYFLAEDEENPELLEQLRRDRRITVGDIRVAPKGRGPEVAEEIAKAYSLSPWAVDEGGVGASVLDHAAMVLGVDATGVSFAARAPERLPGEPWCENTRAALYVRAAMLIDRGLVDAPDDPLLREEILAHELVHGARVVQDSVTGKKERKPTVRILEKHEIKRKIGRSPDRADAFVLSLFTTRVRLEAW